jgi:hypothetical protein
LISPLKTFGNKFTNSGEDSDRARGTYYREREERKRVEKREEEDRTVMGFRNLEPDRKFAKENRFLNEKKQIEEKFKDEDKQLLEKYGARFGINPDECKFWGRMSDFLDFGKSPGVGMFGQTKSGFNAMSLNKRISTPFAEPKRYDTFYRPKRFQNGYN